MMMKRILHRAVPVIALGLILPLMACSSEPANRSDLLVTDVLHSSVKRQSIGNCWLYAHASWTESLHLSATGEELNVSESYWTWWHWYEQIVGSNITRLATGGYWSTSTHLILSHGLVLEGEFLPDERDLEMSQAQSFAQATINEALAAGGALASPSSRTPENVRAALDSAFGSHMAESEKVARRAADFVVGKLANGSPLTLDRALAGNESERWTYLGFPRVYGQTSAVGPATQAQRKAIFARAFKALNDHQPVVMTLMIDFNALDITDQTFKASTLAAAGSPGVQGGHMVVLEDYVVENVPGFGFLGEGELPAEQKLAALQGDLVYLKSKNSWGSNRPDRGLTDGYTRFDVSYLTQQLAWKNGDGSNPANVSYYTTLEDFWLPPGY